MPSSRREWIWMPINKKIIKLIKDADCSENMRNLMIEILKTEDNGSYKYTSDYDKLIKKYLNSD